MPWAHSSLFVLASLLGGSTTAYEATHPAIYAGTYEIRLCHGSCAEAAYFTGTLVLFEQPLRDSQGHAFRAELDREPVNGCFVRVQTSTDEHAYVGSRGYFSWAVQDGAAYFQLARSPDGGYGVSLKLVPKGLRGTGRIWVDAVGLADPDSPAVPPDVVIADRLGAADIKQCPPPPEPVMHQVGQPRR
jgi:hypothetical protein